MTIDLEPVVDLAAAGVVANAIEGEKGKAAPGEHASGPCANCGSELAGPYCHHCGQAAHVHRSLWHIAEEAVHGIFHFDTKSWRTLPLLIAQPGKLTRRYIDGQRVRYVSPLALFLFTVFLMFFVYSLVGTSAPNSSTGDPKEARAELTKEVEKDRQLVEKSTAKLANATNDEQREAAREELGDAQDELQGVQTGLAALDLAETLKPTDKTDDAASSDKPREPLSERLSKKLDTKLGSKVEFEKDHPTLTHAVKHAIDDPELAMYKLKNGASKFSFLLVPISLPFLWLMFFWRSGVRVYDHAIFSLYSLSFMSLLFTVIALLSTSKATQVLMGFLFFVPPIHMFLHLKGTYGLGFFGAFWRTNVLLFICGTVFVIFLITVAAISLH
jgi:Protein of unknown function (DUF3667)